MVDYRIVKYCRNCKKRYLVHKGENKKYLCEECYKKMKPIQPKRTKARYE
jgi:hypothetical protein